MTEPTHGPFRMHHRHHALSGASETDGNPVDQIDAVFTISIVPTVSVSSPNGGEDWQVGSVHNITWKYLLGTSGNVRIEYSVNNGSAWTDLTASTTDDGSYAWTIPNVPSSSCLVRVSDTDGSPTDLSNAVFTISPVPVLTVASPNGGESFQVGSSQAITWTSIGTVGNVRIELSVNNGAAWADITASTVNDGSYLDCS